MFLCSNVMQPAGVPCHNEDMNHEFVMQNTVNIPSTRATAEW